MVKDEESRRTFKRYRLGDVEVTEETLRMPPGQSKQITLTLLPWAFPPAFRAVYADGLWGVACWLLERDGGLTMSYFITLSKNSLMSAEDMRRHAEEVAAALTRIYGT